MRKALQFFGWFEVNYPTIYVNDCHYGDEPFHKLIVA
jgi:hypothetical protein